MRKTFRALCCILLCVALLLPSLSMALAVPERAPLQVGIISDIHYFGIKCAGNYCQSFLDFARNNTYQREETPGLLESALAALEAHAKENGMKYVLIPGDLTPNGEYINHVELAERLEKFEADTGLSVIVINGNHDINNYRGISFESGSREKARATTPEDYLEIYKNLGYDLAYHTYTPKTGKAGMLSYSVQLEGGYRLIALDVAKYSGDVTADGEDVQQTDGTITDDLMAWALDEIADAIANGETPIGMEHHSIVEHFENQNTLFKAFLVDDWQERAEAFADAGLSVMFTGHMHDASVTEWVSDNGNIIYDVSSPSLTSFPNYFREVLFDNTDTFTMDIKNYDVDCVLPVTANGRTFDVPYKTTYSFGKSYGYNSLTNLALSFVSGTIDSFLDAVNSEGSIVAALKSQFGLDVEALIGQYIDVRLGSVEIFTAKNVMSFIDDLDQQLQEKVLVDRDHVYALVEEVLDRLLNLQVSDLPCTKYIDTYGFGDPSKPGTFEDAAFSALVTLYTANQSIEEDPFLTDVLDFFKNRGGAEILFNELYDLLLNDLVQDTLLGHLDFNINTLFPTGTLGHVSMTMFDNVLSLLFHGNKSYTNIINSVLSLGIIPEMTSINGIADYYIGEYLTQSQFDSLGYTISNMIQDIVTDHGDGEDLNRTLTPGKREVVASRENYRLPSIVTVTLGEDASTQRNISWYTKFTVTGSDIEIVPYSENPSFSGTPTKSGVTATCERHDRTFPGVDLGFIGFMPTKQPLNRHTVRLTGLTPGTKYCYRVGDASRGWWSEVGTLETADNSDAVTFLHIADPQSQNTVQYERFHTVLQSAFAEYPNAKMVVSTGDQVDNGTNVNQWKWLTDVSSDLLMDTVFMPATGNHEKTGAALDENFILPNVPEQDTDSGVYYDYDYNNVHFMVLNTNDTTDKEGLSETQLNWLKDSAENSDAQWKIVVLHKATYSNGSHFDDKEVVAMRKQFKRLFPELDIDMVLEGHDHVYLRTDSMYSNLVIKSKTKTVSYGGRDYTVKIDPYGTFYVISGCAGVKNYLAKSTKATDKLFPRAEALYDTMSSMFSAIQVKGNTLYFDAFVVDADGKSTRVDNFAIEKTGAKKSVFSAILPNATSDTIGSVEAISEIEPLVAAQANDIIEMDYPVDEDKIVVPDADATTTKKATDSSASADTKTTTAKSAEATTKANDTVTTTKAADAQKSNAVLGVTTINGQTVVIEKKADTAPKKETTTAATGTAEDADSVSTLFTTTSDGKIPKLGGNAPVATVSVLFGGLLLGLLTFSRKKSEE